MSNISDAAKLTRIVYQELFCLVKVHVIDTLRDQLCRTSPQK